MVPRAKLILVLLRVRPVRAWRLVSTHLQASNKKNGLVQKMEDLKEGGWEKCRLVRDLLDSPSGLASGVTL